MGRTSVEFLDEIKQRNGLRSDYALAKHLGVRVQLISNYRNKRSFPDEVMACRLADELGLPRGYVLAMVAAERAERGENGDLADTWRSLAKKMRVTALLGFLTLAPILHSQNVQAVPLEGGGNTHMRQRRREWPAVAWKQAAKALSRWARGLAYALTISGAFCLGRPAVAAEWSTGDTWRELAYQGLLAVDCRQTWQGSVTHPEQFQETNPVMGPNPSKRRVIGVCVASSAGHYLISRALPNDWRVLWQSVTIFAELYAVDNNVNAGLGLRVVF
jgi:transcriptional regulator with XRE-family HTH domain